MTTKPKILKWIAIILFLFAVQTLTYFTLGQRLLKNKLLPNYFASLTHQSDSVFVRDFYVTDCPTGTDTYTSHHLNKDSELIKKKLNVDFVYFDNFEYFSWDDTTAKKYNLFYETWIARPDWVTLFGFYSVRQVEILQTDKKYLHKRDVTYHWFFFFWIPTFEWSESTDLTIR